MALAFGAMLFGEHANAGRLFGLALLIVGMFLIEGGSAEAATDQPRGGATAHARPL